jgi:hypothetical protein
MSNATIWSIASNANADAFSMFSHVARLISHAPFRPQCTVT